MSTNKNVKSGTIIDVLIAACCVCGAVKYFKDKKSLNEKIRGLEEEINSLKEKDSMMEDTDSINYSDKAFNYLAIGNSITKHGLAEYWWNETGMAASSEEKDYVHLISSYLKSQNKEVCCHVCNFFTWEVQAADRAETLELIEKYLNEKLDLVTIQLGENVNDFSTYANDYEELIRYIQVKAPNAQIIVIDDFWNAGDKSILKEKASKNTGVPFVSLEEIKDNTDYQCGLGTIVYDKEGNGHTVEHAGVAKHPGDKGMEYIAHAVIQILQ